MAKLQAVRKLVGFTRYPFSAAMYRFSNQIENKVEVGTNTLESFQARKIVANLKKRELEYKLNCILLKGVGWREM